MQVPLKPEKQVGVFSYLGMYKPLGGVIRTGGVGVPYSLFDTGFSFGEAFMIGPGFRKKSGANIEILAGVGPALYFFGLGSGATNGLVLQVGLGGDVNINFCLSERMYLNLGLRAQASFYSYTFVFDPTVASFKPTNYRSYAINPRLGIGFRH